jgi:hypothetical protein
MLARSVDAEHARALLRSETLRSLL